MKFIVTNYFLFNLWKYMKIFIGLVHMEMGVPGRLDTPPSLQMQYL